MNRAGLSTIDIAIVCALTATVLLAFGAACWALARQGRRRFSAERRGQGDGCV